MTESARGARGTRTLWLLRHAKTEREPPPGGTDFDRVLTARGRRNARALGRLFAGRGDGLGHDLDGVPRPSAVLVSPSARTAATARTVLAELADPPEIRLVDELYGADPKQVLTLVQSLPDEVEAAMVVGHNPTAETLARELLASDDTQTRARVVRHGFPTCALGVYRFGSDRWREADAGSATLVALMRPPYA